MDDHQVHVPTSFQDLFRVQGRTKLTEPWPHILARYEVCEDMAQALTAPARSLQGDLGITASDVAGKIAVGLDDPAIGLAPEERQWVVTRLVELMETP